ncbi:HAMP domain-containing histidine kinase [Candidatus Peregrinibacteria bacterium]|jgi:signal transduction histidine kinase|nr:HAMP domain-containing histidine kinase [Candidatus Peregrinibacteria bacterium]
MEKTLKPFMAQDTCGKMHSITLLKNNLPIHFSLALKNKKDVPPKEQWSFFRDLIHEMGTPLTILNCSMEDLKEKYSTEPILNSCSTELEILQNSLYLNEVLLALETQEIMQTYFEKISLSMLAEFICNQFQTVLGKRFRFDIQEELWVYAQEDILHYIIVNLLQSAQKHTSKNEEIHLLLFEKNKKVHLKVSDSGMGMSSNDMSYLFAKYYRTPTSKKNGIRGTGLSLCIIKNLVHALDGSINVCRNGERGVAFCIELPAVLT